MCAKVFDSWEEAQVRLYIDEVEVYIYIYIYILLCIYIEKVCTGQ